MVQSSLLPATLDAIILAGGRGTRLQSVVSDRPKPMAAAARRPFVEWLLLALRTQDIRHVVLATGYKDDIVEEYFAGGARLGMKLVYAHETVPLVTGGDACPAWSRRPRSASWSSTVIPSALSTWRAS